MVFHCDDTEITAVGLLVFLPLWGLCSQNMVCDMILYLTEASMSLSISIILSRKVLSIFLLDVFPGTL